MADREPGDDHDNEMGDLSETDLLRVTWFDRKEQTKGGKDVTFSRRMMIHALREAGDQTVEKLDLPLVCMSSFTDGHRCNASVDRVHQLGLDVDQPTADPAGVVEQIRAVLGGVETFAYSTASSAENAYKLRVLIPYDAPAVADDHRASWRLVARRLARVGILVDRQCSDPARGFFVWIVPPNGVYWNNHLEGHAWPVHRAAELERRHEPEVDASNARPVHVGERGPGVLRRAQAYIDRMEPAIAGSGGHDACWSVARKLVADFMLDRGQAMDLILEYNARCKPPWSLRELEHKIDQAFQARVSNPVQDRGRR